jgi:hypothetical protein
MPRTHRPDSPPKLTRVEVRRLLFAIRIGTPRARVTARRTLIDAGLPLRMIDDLLRPAA